jgi:RNA polymerase sigma-70 factor (ECF subfamily)
VRLDDHQEDSSAISPINAQDPARARPQGLNVLRGGRPNTVNAQHSGPDAESRVMTDSELVVRARAGDVGAFESLMSTRIDHMSRIAQLVLRDRDLAEDAVQEGLVRCWRDLPSLRDPERFDAWVNRVLVRAVHREARGRRRAAASVAVLRAEPARPDGSSAVADKDEIARVFDRLSVEHRTIVVLRHYLDLTMEECAATIGIPVGTAKSRLHYATDALRAALEADARAETRRAFA